MFGLGFWELAVVILLAVMLFPPRELPKLARSMARTYGSLRRTAEDFRNTVMHDEDLREPLDEIRGAYNDARWQVRDVERQARHELAKARTEARLVSESMKGRAAAEPPQLAVGGLDDDEDEQDSDAEAFYAAAQLDSSHDRGDAVEGDSAPPEADVSSSSPKHPEEGAA